MQLRSPRLETTNADWLVILQVLPASTSHPSSPSCVFTINRWWQARGETNAWGILRRGKLDPDCKTSALRQSAIRKGNTRYREENKADMQKKNVATRDHAVKIISDIIIYGFYNVLYGPSKNQLFLFHFSIY